MAWSARQYLSTSAAGAGTTLLLAYPQTVQVGDLLVCFCEWGGATLTNAVTDTQTNVWTAVPSTLVTAGALRGEIYWAKAKSSGANTVTMTTSASSTERAIFLFEGSGFDTTGASPVDTQNTGTGSSANPSINLTVGAPSMIFGGVITTASQVAGAGYTDIGVANGDDAEFRLSMGTGVQAVPFVGIASTWGVAAASFKVVSEPLGKPLLTMLNRGGWWRELAIQLIQSRRAPALNADPYAQTILGTAGLVSYWRVDDTGSAAVDSKGSNPGSYVGTPPLANTLVIGGVQAHDFNGSSQYVTIPGTASLQPASFTVEAWVNLDSFGAGRRIITLADETVGLQIDASGHLQVTYWQGTLYRTVTSTAVLTAGTTFHVAGTFDDATKVLTGYINGAVDGQNTFAAQPIVWDAVTTSAIGSGSGGLSANDLDGRIDEVAVYNIALATASLLAHYQLGAGAPPAGGPAIIPLSTSDAVSTGTLALTAQTGITLATSAAQSAGTLALTAQTQVPLGAATAQSAATLALTAPTQVPLQPAAAQSAGTLALTAPAKVVLGTSAAQSTGTLALTAPTQIPLQASAAVATGSLAGLYAPGEVIVPLGTSAATASATLAVTAQTTIPLASSTATSNATLALTAQTRVALGTATAQGSATLAVTAQTGIPLGAGAATSTATLALTAPTRVTLGTSAAQSAATLALTAQTYIALGASAATSSATLSVTAGPGVIPFQPSTATSTATLAVRALTLVPLGTSAAVSSAALTVSTPTQTFIPLATAAGTSTATLALKAQTRVTLQTAAATSAATLALFTPTAALLTLGAANANSTGGVLQMVQMGGRWPAHTGTRWPLDIQTHWHQSAEPNWAASTAAAGTRWDVDPQPHW